VKGVVSKGVLRALRKAGPYAVVELLLPGGTLLALFLWLSSSSGRGAFAEEHPARIIPSVSERVVAMPNARRGELRVA
jgi:hypothetical protein